MSSKICEEVCAHLGDALRYHRLGGLFLTGFEFAQAITALNHPGLDPKEAELLNILVTAVGETFQIAFGLFDEPVAPPRTAVRRPRRARVAQVESRQAILDALVNSRISTNPAFLKLKQEWEAERKQ